jgi:carbon-monoxide dehydrogenase medium subunit
LVRDFPHFVRIPQLRAVVIAGKSGRRERPRQRPQQGRLEETMIPGQFSYHRPATLADAVNLLVTLGEEARPLAGGHSLVPMMKLRLATPEHLVDLQGIADSRAFAATATSS